MKRLRSSAKTTACASFWRPESRRPAGRLLRQLKFGGNFTISANFVIKKLPKPAQEDGAAIGLAIAFQDPNQPDVTLVRLIEPKGPEVYRSIEKARAMQGPMPIQMMRGQVMMPMMMMGQPGGNQPKPPRRTFPAAGEIVRMELIREGNTIRYQVVDATSTRATISRPGRARAGMMWPRSSCSPPTATVPRRSTS